MASLPALLCALLAAQAWAAPAPLALLRDPRARCLDGSPAGAYVQRASRPADAARWVLFLNGGGECDTEAACKAQLGSALGSSKFLPNTSDASGWYLASDDCVKNPDFCGWNHVMDPYCTQDLHSGQMTAPSAATWGLRFSGFHVVTATLDYLDATSGLRDASDIIVHGMSAGGIGVWMVVDYVHERYPKARVTAVTVAGHYFPATYYTGPDATPPSSMGDFRAQALPETYQLYDAFVDRSCAAHMQSTGRSPGECLLSNTSLAFIESDAFIVQALTDQTVLTGHDCWPQNHMADAPEQTFLQQWAANMSVALQPIWAQPGLQAPRRGVFGAACYTHVGFTNTHPIVAGLNYYQAVGNFYFNRTTEDKYRVVDTCGIMCNPTCDA